jgi:hypothetical protein
MSKERQKKRKTILPRLKDYYYNPPYGCRYWILMPFMDEKNEELQYQITKDFGELNIRPMFKIDL